ncbi:MAG: HAMP domain-containing histidine kinase [Bacteroidales bacterium]|jgi:two-component sensor histidine kinase|nr:HAMP domain-containing histidine kinase [Bacteroidales bacterium]
MKAPINKPYGKLLLYISSAIVFVVIMWYSNTLISNIAKEERRRIEIWADAISYKASLVNYTEKFFDKIRAEEGKHASLYAQALQRVNMASLDEDVSLYLSIIASNKTIPSMIVKANGEIETKCNLPESWQNKKYIWEIENYQNLFDSLKMQYDAHQYVTVFYQESEIYTNLREVLDNLLQSFFQEVVINSVSVPVIVTDETDHEIITYGNLDSSDVHDSQKLADLIANMKSENTPISIRLPNDHLCHVFYEESSVLQQLRLFPYLQMLIVIIFVVSGYLIYSVSRRAEQDRIWVGMSKETAHQLGTPISSLMAWTELLKEQQVSPSLIEEMEKDVHRLETIAQRFSKIGSLPELKNEDLNKVLNEFILYLKNRVPGKIKIDLILSDTPDLVLSMNRHLFAWVLENLCKNAIDAMNGRGQITIAVSDENRWVHVDVKDTGKGIPQRKQKQIFTPGFTTKSRGWGLGLTLSRRIIKEYHKGKLFVKSSTPNEGTVMRISLKKNDEF